MAYKYKLSEMSKTASERDAEKELDKPTTGFKVGQVTFSDDGTTTSTITDIDPVTGAVSWNIKQLPGFEKLYDEVDDFVEVAKRVYVKTKDDKKFREFYEQARKIRNAIRTHLRNEYPDQYKRIVGVSENIDVIDIAPSNNLKLRNFISGPDSFAQAMLDIADEILDDEASNIKQNINIKNALKLLGAEANKAKKPPIKERLQEDSQTRISEPRFVKDKNNPNFLNVYIDYATPEGAVVALGKETMSGQIRRKSAAAAVDKLNNIAKDLTAKYNVEDIEVTDLENGKAQLFAVSDDFIDSINENVGATLGPGPKAGPDGVTDNYYVKGFKYKLVPKTKNGTYVQKGSGLEVKKLF